MTYDSNQCSFTSVNSVGIWWFPAPRARNRQSALQNPSLKLPHRNYSERMMQPKQPQQNKLKQKFISYVDGPLLFTAPHSKKVYRGGPITKDKRRLHLREIHTSALAVDFALISAQQLEMDKNTLNSFCIWGKSVAVDEDDLDPNYLHESQYALSPFHQTLHKFQLKHAAKNTPLFHVDIHGKFDVKDRCELDVGLACMEEYWDEPELVAVLKNYFTREFNKIFKGIKIGGFDPICNCQPYLSGLWGGSMATMNEQSIKLGIPSIQLEIPRKMRNLLASSAALRQSFVGVLVGAYRTIICRWHPTKLFKNIYLEDLAKLLPQQTYKRKDCQELLGELQAMQNKAKLDLNARII